MLAAIARVAVDRMRTDSGLGARVGREGMIAACLEGARRIGGGYGDGGLAGESAKLRDGVGGGSRDAGATLAHHSALASAPGMPGTALDAP